MAVFKDESVIWVLIQWYDMNLVSIKKIVIFGKRNTWNCGKQCLCPHLEKSRRHIAIALSVCVSVHVCVCPCIWQFLDDNSQFTIRIMAVINLTIHGTLTTAILSGIIVTLQMVELYHGRVGILTDKIFLCLNSLGQIGWGVQYSHWHMYYILDIPLQVIKTLVGIGCWWPWSISEVILYHLELHYN